MTANTLTGAPLSLGGFLRDRRERLPPSPGSDTRRRTPGLRREEVAARACVSVTWYTWLEQGRGGAASVEVLERLARALELDESGREVLFLLAQQRPPPVRAAPTPEVPASLQRVLDAFAFAPAIVKTSTWDVVAWNAAARAVLVDYAALTVANRNVLRMLFLDQRHERTPDWEANVRYAIAVFRVDVARTGASAEAAVLVDELLAASPDFRRIWAENEIAGHWAGVKRIRHPIAGLLTLEPTGFSVNAADGLSMIVFNPATPADEAAIIRLLAHAAEAG